MTNEEREEYFWSLVPNRYKYVSEHVIKRAPEQEKMRRCLRCNREFLSKHYGHRQCYVCRGKSSRVSPSIERYERHFGDEGV